MKKILAAFTLGLLLIACGKKELPVEKVTFGIEVLNPTEKVVVIEQLLPNVELEKGVEPYVDTLELDSNNWVKIEREDLSEGYYAFTYDKHQWQVYLQPGKTLYAQLNGKEPETSLEYQGKLKKTANYLHEKNEVLKAVMKGLRPAFGYSEEEYLNYIDSSRKVLDSMLVQFTTNNTRFNPEFMRRQELDNYYREAEWLVYYPMYRDYYVEGDSMPPLSEAFFEQLNSVNLNDTGALEVNQYLSFLGTKIEQLSYEKINGNLEETQNDRYAWYRVPMEVADSLFTDQKLRDYFFYKATKDMVAYESPSINDSLYQVFANECQNKAYEENIAKEIASWNKLKAGNPAPDFYGVTLEGDTVYLSDLKGKYVYIDVWATWCGPCLSEIPYLKDLEHDFKREVTFLSISIDQSESAWRYKVEEDHLKGIQIHANKEASKALSESYKIEAIPRFILIDPEGNIVDANAPRPSTGADEFIASLL